MCVWHWYIVILFIQNICIFTYTKLEKELRIKVDIYPNEDISQWNRLKEKNRMSQRVCVCVHFWIGEGCLKIISCVYQ